MAKPEPKQEIKVERIADLSVLFIFVASRDAAEWVAQEAPAFGLYHPPSETEDWCSLHVSPLYDPDEVRHYLESQGQTE